MGKVFVKGPVESPDDLLLKGPRMEALRRGGEEFGARALDGASRLNFKGAGREGLVGAKKIVDNDIENFSDLMGIPVHMLGALFGGKPPTPEQMEMARLQARQNVEEAMRPQQEAQAALAAKEKEEADNQALLGRFQNLSQRKGAEAAQLSGHKGATDLADYEEYARQNYPGMPLNEVANMLGQQFTNVEGLDLRRRMTGKEGIEGFGPAQQTAQGLETASDAAEGEAESLPAYDFNEIVHPGASAVPEALDLDEEVIGQAAAKINAQLQPTIGPADNAISVIRNGGVNSSADSAVKENERDDAMINNPENTDAAATPSNAAVMAAAGKKEKPDFSQATTGGAKQVPAETFNFGAGPPPLPRDVPPSRDSEAPRTAFDRERFPDGSGRWR